MPWQEASTMSLRSEFVTYARQPDANIRQLCQRFGISPKTGYKWLGRVDEAGRVGLADRSRRPHTSPSRTAATVEAEVIAVRTTHPTWGGRKIRATLLAASCATVPSASTITAILRRHDVLTMPDPQHRSAWQRFEHAAPNDLWQMDYKGYVPLGQGTCHPLTVLDDHSRFLVGLHACPNEQATTVKAALTPLFRRYGLPWTILCDNGAPWGAGDPHFPLTALSAWLIRLGIRVIHGGAYHPQTQGKIERLHRTLKAEALQPQQYATLDACQHGFDHWRTTYNELRPHDAIGLLPPLQRYQPSPRPFPEILPPIDYGPDAVVRMVQRGGEVSYLGREHWVSGALRGQQVALRPTPADGLLAVVYCQQVVATIDLREPR